MKAVARVRDVQGDRAVLSCETATATCGSCGGRGCALRWLSGRDGVVELPLQSPGVAGLVPGDGVVVEVNEGELLRVAALAYLAPLAGMLAGALSAHLAFPGVELAALAMAGAGLVAGWAWSRARLRSRPPRYSLTPGDAQ
jgi:positive regulator of sigma E activity